LPDSIRTSVFRDSSIFSAKISWLISASRRLADTTAATASAHGKNAPSSGYSSRPKSKLIMLYQELTMWKRIAETTAVRYRCLMNSANKKISVQSADFYRLPLTQEQVLQFQTQFVELFCECDPGERSDSFDSLEEAIAAHERSFDPSV
jgi:hypothetical protein